MPWGCLGNQRPFGAVVVVSRGRETSPPSRLCIRHVWDTKPLPWPWRSIPILPLFRSLVYYQCLEYEFSPQPDPAPGSEFSLSLRLIIPCPSFIASPLRVGSGSSPPGLHILQIFAAGFFCLESLLDCAEPWARGRACLAAGCSSTGHSWDCPRR